MVVSPKHKTQLRNTAPIQSSRFYSSGPTPFAVKLWGVCTYHSFFIALSGSQGLMAHAEHVCKLLILLSSSLEIHSAEVQVTPDDTNLGKTLNISRHNEILRSVNTNDYLLNNLPQILSQLPRKYYRSNQKFPHLY